MKNLYFSDSIDMEPLSLAINNRINQGCYQEILQCIHGQLSALLSYHCKVLVIRFDLHVHDYTGSNKLISNFYRKLKKKIYARYKMTRIGHIWVREVEKAKRQHYHCTLILDANKIRYPKSILTIIDSIWTAWDQPKPFTPKNCYYLIERHDIDKYKKCFYRLSYLAKARGKGHKDKTANNYSASRYKPVNSS